MLPGSRNRAFSSPKPPFHSMRPFFANFVTPEGVSLPLPEPLFRVLSQTAAALVAGDQVVVAPLQHPLTTQQAADLLNVSRPYLIRLLDTGEIPSQKVGRHRRVTFGDLMEYKKRRVSERRQALENLIRESEELGLYDRPSGKK